MAFAPAWYAWHAQRATCGGPDPHLGVEPRRDDDDARGEFRGAIQRPRPVGPSGLWSLSAGSGRGWAALPCPTPRQGRPRPQYLTCLSSVAIPSLATEV